MTTSSTGIFTGSQSNQDTPETDTDDQGIDCGVEGVKADDTYKDNPVFDVGEKEFFKNMRQDRNRMRFSQGSKVFKFMQGTKYRSSFYIRYTNGKGEKLMKKIK